MARSIDFEIRISGDGSSELRRISVAAESAEDAIERISAAATGAGTSLRRAAAESITLSGVSSALSSLKGLVGDMVAPYRSFESSMARANTMAGTSGAEFDALTDTIRGLSSEIPMAREALAEGLYETVSNGVPKDNWIDYLRSSARTAKGGCADLGQTVSVTATLIKNYGESWDKAAAIQDKMQMTAKNGKTSIAELGDALPRVSGSASQLGVHMDELMAVFATTTGVTGKTSEVSTQFAAVLNSLIKPSSEATKAAEAMGIKFDAASVRACGGFQNFLIQLDDSVKEYAASSGQLSETIYGQLFGSAEALRILGSLTGEQKDTFAANIAAMADSAGSIDAAFEMMSDTGESTTQRIKNAVSSVTDYISGSVSWAAPFIEMAASAGIAVTGIAQLSVFVKGLGLASKAAAVSHGIAAAATKVWTVAQYGLNAALSANPIGLIVLAIAALVAGIIYAYNNCEEFRTLCDKTWAVIKVLAAAIWDFLVAAFEKVSTVVKTAWEWVKKFFGISDDVDETSTALKGNADAAGRAADANGKLAEGGLKAAKAADWQKMSYEELGKAIDAQKEKVSKLAGTNAANAKAEAERLKQMQNRYKQLGKQFNLSENSGTGLDGKTLVKNASSYKELANNITYYQNKLEKTKATETEEIKALSQTISALKKKQEALKLLHNEYARPTQLNTLSDYEDEIAYQESLLKNASQAEAQAINGVIKKLREEKEAFEKVQHIPVSIDKITTQKQLSEELNYYNELLETGNAAERMFAQRNINALNDLRKKWDGLLADMAEPVELGACESVEELEGAIGILEARAKRSGAEGAIAAARLKVGYERALGVLRERIEIPGLAAEAARIEGLTGSEHVVAVRGIGFDKLGAEIKRLEELLRRAGSGMGAEERKEIEDLIGVYRKWQRESVDGIGSVRKGWDGLKGAVSGVTAMSEAMKGHATVWERVTGLVDGALGVYDSFVKLAEVVRVVTMALGLAKQGEAVATEAATAATALGGATAVATAGEEAAASGVVTTAKVEEAAAKTMAAHAGVPWVGIAIAGGMVAAMTAMMLTLPKFANGGIAYGPTVGVFGEYAGASSNPEVVAPLDRLRSLLGDAGGGGVGGGRVEFEISGRVLRGVLRRVEEFDRRTR